MYIVYGIWCTSYNKRTSCLAFFIVQITTFTLSGNVLNTKKRNSVGKYHMVKVGGPVSRHIVTFLIILRNGIMQVFATFTCSRTIL